MSRFVDYWPFLVLVAVIVGLVAMSRTGRYRSPVPVVVAVPVQSEREGTPLEVTQLAEIVRSGAFYVCGTVLDWSLCCEFADKIVSGARDSNEF